MYFGCRKTKPFTPMGASDGRIGYGSHGIVTCTDGSHALMKSIQVTGRGDVLEMLTEREAVAIYEIKIELKYQIILECFSPSNFSSLWGKTGPISKRYGVSSRTVKYIWNRQTWTHATNHLWPDEPEIANLKRTRLLSEHENGTLHSATSSQSEAWIGHLSQGSRADRFNSCTTAPSPFQPGPSSLDEVTVSISGTGDVVSGTAAPWIMSSADRLSGGRPERLHQSADPPQIMKTAPDPPICTIPNLPFFLPKAASSPAPAVADAILGLEAELQSLHALDPTTLGADPFHADWPHW